MVAFAIAVGAQMAYLAFRFRWTYAAAAVVSMAHVVLTVVGVFAWLDKPVDGIFLAAILSIIGLAVNDTIVVFDRIRERTRASTDSLRETVNAAILQTVPRTLNTGLGAMFILAALAVLGGDSLQDFAIALLLGLSVGIYSTMFTAAPLADLGRRTLGHKIASIAPRRDRPLRRRARRRTRQRVSLGLRAGIPAPQARARTTWFEDADGLCFRASASSSVRRCSLSPGRRDAAAPRMRT